MYFSEFKRIFAAGKPATKSLQTGDACDWLAIKRAGKYILELIDVILVRSRSRCSSKEDWVVSSSECEKMSSLKIGYSITRSSKLICRIVFSGFRDPYQLTIHLLKVRAYYRYKSPHNKVEVIINFQHYYVSCFSIWARFTTKERICLLFCGD